MAFDNGDSFARIREPRCQGRTRLASPDYDCVEMPYSPGTDCIAHDCSDQSDPH
jgi:hypothetical protein